MYVGVLGVCCHTTGIAKPQWKYLHRQCCLASQTLHALASKLTYCCFCCCFRRCLSAAALYINTAIAQETDMRNASDVIVVKQPQRQRQQLTPNICHHSHVTHTPCRPTPFRTALEASYRSCNSILLLSIWCCSRWFL